MKINGLLSPPTTEFQDIRLGHTFVHQGALYLRCVYNNCTSYAVNLATGQLYTFVETSPVISRDAEVKLV